MPPYSLPCRPQLLSILLHPEGTLPYHPTVNLQEVNNGIRSFGIRFEPRYIFGALSLD